jgi:ATP/maltotriose-dependent transcriptional regulator MalT
MPHSPISLRRSIRRERLLAVLSEWRAVTPAGFGKTTLGVQWFQQMADMPEAEPPARAWVALDHTDDAPERFLRRLVDALSPDFAYVFVEQSAGKRAARPEPKRKGASAVWGESLRSPAQHNA